MQVLFRVPYGAMFTQQEVYKLNAVIDSDVKLQLEPLVVEVGQEVSKEEADAPRRLTSYFNTYTAELLDIYTAKPDLQLEVQGIAAGANYNRLMEKLSVLEHQLGQFQSQSFNQKCEVHVPGLGLLAIEETMVLEDACTDRLDNELAQGWRIVAVCPQPDQRRPDYVLGRTRRG